MIKNLISRKNITIKEIMNKYPDKVMKKGVIDRERDIVVVMDTCKIIMRKTGSKQWEQEV